ncbi:MAG: CinA family protein [Pseudomonadota bacterium]|nr:CinA family protein [Pseudomonadota bacterium]HJO35504.1 CinA family protein [Gammaproteobacteria bacterium]
MATCETVEPLVQRLADELRARHLRLVVAESCTGGLLAAALTALPGSSAWFDRGLVTYSNAAKTALLGVPATMLARCGAVSEPVARQMASGALHNGAADLAVAITGIAGPEGGTPDKPVGTVWIAWAARSRTPASRCYLFEGERAQVRAASVRAALEGLIPLAGGQPAAGR